MKYRVLVVLGLIAFLGWAVPVSAQVTIGPSQVYFESPDHSATLSSGGAAITFYQAIVLDASADAVSGPPLQTGLAVPKTSVTIVTPTPAGMQAPVYRLSFTQLGVTTPPCTIAQGTCPQYTIVLESIGPNGISARGIAAETNPFQAVSTAAPPAGPRNVRALP